MTTESKRQSKSKPLLSIQYLVSNRGIEDIFTDPEMLPKIIEAGPDKLKEILAGLWNAYKEEYSDVFELVDIDRKISKDDFQVECDMDPSENPILFITFPDMIGATTHAEAKCFAAIFKNGKFPPRMFTMEYYNESSEKVHKGRFILGEWKPENDGAMRHINMGIMDGTTVADFMDIIKKACTDKEP